jgi:hypothetical protein
MHARTLSKCEIIVAHFRDYPTIHMEPTLTDRLDEERAHTVRPNRGRGRMKEVHSLLGRAGVRQASLFSSDMYGLCF